MPLLPQACAAHEIGGGICESHPRAKTTASRGWRTRNREAGEAGSGFGEELVEAALLWAGDPRGIVDWGLWAGIVFGEC
jgi:hypothetical protein